MPTPRPATFLLAGVTSVRDCSGCGREKSYFEAADGLPAGCLFCAHVDPEDLPPVCAHCGKDVPRVYPFALLDGRDPEKVCPTCLDADAEVRALSLLVRSALRLGPLPRIRDTIPAPPPAGCLVLVEGAA